MLMRLYFAAFGILLATVSSLQATDIIWNAPQQISGESDVSLTGSAFRAYKFASSGPANVINGVSFSQFVDQSTDTSTFDWLGVGVFASTSTPYTNMSSAYQSILSSGFYNLSAGTSASLSINGLNPGDSYQVQVWVNDSRNYTRTETINSSSALSLNTTGLDGGLGQYIIGTFTADGTGSKTLTFSPDGSTTAQINGLQLRNLSVPEPSTYALATLATGVMAYVASRRKLGKK